MSNRYRVKRTCHTKPIVTDCLLPCGPAVWESLTTASTRLSLRHLRARVRNQVSVQVVACFVPTVIFAILIHFYEFQSFVFLVSSLTSLPTLHISSCCVCVGKRRYSHDFLLQLRFGPATCVRPLDLELIPGVTDNTPGTMLEYRNRNITYGCSTICITRFSCSIWSSFFFCTDASRYCHRPNDKRSVNMHFFLPSCLRTCTVYNMRWQCSVTAANWAMSNNTIHVQATPLNRFLNLSQFNHSAILHVTYRKKKEKKCDVPNDIKRGIKAQLGGTEMWF